MLGVLLCITTEIVSSIQYLKIYLQSSDFRKIKDKNSNGLKFETEAVEEFFYEHVSNSKSLSKITS